MTSEPLSESGDDPKRSRAARVENQPGAAAATTAWAPAYAPAYAVDVSFVSDEEIAQLNRDYRHKNKPTDVLSFSQLEGEFMSGAPGDEAVPLGDLVISIETAQRQAAQLGHALEREVEFLAVHGALHLLGYDHRRAADRRVMWRWQEEIIEEMQNEKCKMQNDQSSILHF